MWTTVDTMATNWLSVCFLLLFGTFVLTYKMHGSQASLFLRLLDFSTYLKVYQKNTGLLQSQNFHQKLNIFSAGSISILLTIIFAHYNLRPLDLEGYLQFLPYFLGILVVRSVLLRLLTTSLGLKKYFSKQAYKNSSLMGVFGLLSFGTALLYVYSPTAVHQLLFPYLFYPLGLLFFIFQLVGLRKIYKSSFKTSIYLFLYFCAFKITPWIWVAYALQILEFNGTILEL